MAYDLNHLNAAAVSIFLEQNCWSQPTSSSSCSSSRLHFLQLLAFPFDRLMVGRLITQHFFFAMLSHLPSPPLSLSLSFLPHSASHSLHLLHSVSSLLSLSTCLSFWIPVHLCFSGTVPLTFSISFLVLSITQSLPPVLGTHPHSFILAHFLPHAHKVHSTSLTPSHTHSLLLSHSHSLCHWFTPFSSWPTINHPYVEIVR